MQDCHIPDISHLVETSPVGRLLAGLRAAIENSGAPFANRTIETSRRERLYSLFTP